MGLRSTYIIIQRRCCLILLEQARNTCCFLAICTHRFSLVQFSSNPPLSISWIPLRNDLLTVSYCLRPHTNLLDFVASMKEQMKRCSVVNTLKRLRRGWRLCQMSGGHQRAKWGLHGKKISGGLCPEGGRHSEWTWCPPVLAIYSPDARWAHLLSRQWINQWIRQTIATTEYSLVAGLHSNGRNQTNKIN